MKLHPLSDRVILKAVAKEETTKSGIVLPGSAKERPQQGVVVEVGPGRTLENGTLVPMTVKVGDTVLFKKYGPEEFTLDEQEYLILSESDIIAVLN